MSERKHGPVFFQALVDLAAVGPFESLQAEAFHGQTGPPRPVSHGPAQAARRCAAVRFQVAENTAGKAVAGAGGVDDLRGGVRGYDGNSVLAKEHGAVLALF